MSVAGTLRRPKLASSEPLIVKTVMAKEYFRPPNTNTMLVWGVRKSSVHPYIDWSGVTRKSSMQCVHVRVKCRRVKSPRTVEIGLEYRECTDGRNNKLYYGAEELGLFVVSDMINQLRGKDLLHLGDKVLIHGMEGQKNHFYVDITPSICPYCDQTIDSGGIVECEGCEAHAHKECVTDIWANDGQRGLDSPDGQPFKFACPECEAKEPTISVSEPCTMHTSALNGQLHPSAKAAAHHAKRPAPGPDLTAGQPDTPEPGQVPQSPAAQHPAKKPRTEEPSPALSPNRTEEPGLASSPNRTEEPGPASSPNRTEEPGPALSPKSTKPAPSYPEKGSSEAQAVPPGRSGASLEATPEATQRASGGTDPGRTGHEERAEGQSTEPSPRAKLASSAEEEGLQSEGQPLPRAGDRKEALDNGDDGSAGAKSRGSVERSSAGAAENGAAPRLLSPLRGAAARPSIGASTPPAAPARPVSTPGTDGPSSQSRDSRRSSQILARLNKLKQDAEEKAAEVKAIQKQLEEARSELSSVHAENDSLREQVQALQSSGRLQEELEDARQGAEAAQAEAERCKKWAQESEMREKEMLQRMEEQDSKAQMVEAERDAMHAALEDAQEALEKERRASAEHLQLLEESRARCAALDQELKALEECVGLEEDG